MSTLFDEPPFCAPPVEGADLAAQSGDPAYACDPLLPRGDGGQAMEAETEGWSSVESAPLGRLFLDAMKQVIPAPAAPEEPSVVPPSVPLGQRILEAMKQVIPTPAAPEEPSVVPPSVPLGQRILEATKQVIPTPAAPEEPSVVDTASPVEHVLPSSPPDIMAKVLAVEHATSKKEAMAAMETFLALAESAVTASMDPVAFLLDTFGPECVATVTKACADAVVELDAATAAAGGQLTEGAASRIASRTIRRVIRGASRTMPRAPCIRRVLRVRVMHAPRARRAHRRAVRLSAVASAGDGPPPQGPRAATRARDRAHRSGTDNSFLPDVAQIDDVVGCAVDLLEQADGEHPPIAALDVELTTAPRMLHKSRLRHFSRRLRAPPRSPLAVRCDASAALRMAAESVGRSDSLRRSTIAMRHEVLQTVEVRR